MLSFDLPALWYIIFSSAHWQWCLWFKALFPCCKGVGETKSSDNSTSNQRPLTSSLVWSPFGIKFTLILFRRIWSALQGVKEYLSETFYDTLDYCWKFWMWPTRQAWLWSKWYEKTESKWQFSIFPKNEREKRVGGIERDTDIQNPSLSWPS